nr:uncharacterized protein LOC109160869 [Ipomoea batatas]
MGPPLFVFGPFFGDNWLLTVVVIRFARCYQCLSPEVPPTADESWLGRMVVDVQRGGCPVGRFHRRPRGRPVRLATRRMLGHSSGGLTVALLFRRSAKGTTSNRCDSAGVLRGFVYEVAGGVGSTGVLCFASWDQNPFQPVVLTEDEGDTNDELHTAPRIPAFTTHGGPRELVRVVSSLTQCQREDVISIGMGGLLGLQVAELPLQLGEWLVGNFDLDMMALKLCNGSYISIATQDVARVLGLSNGPLPISERDGQQVPPELRAWREEIKHRKGKITVKALGTQMLELKDGGEWFRRHFSVIVVSSLIASVSNGYAN